MRVELRGFLIGLALEVQFEITTRPAQNLENRLISEQRPVGGVLHLSLNKKYFAFLAFVIQFELAALAPHFQRLHQIDHIHLRKVSANHAVGGRCLRHLFQGDAVHRALDAPCSFFQKKRLRQIIIGRILRR